MELIHNPKNLKLPPLRIEKNSARENMEKNEKILNFINSNLLLDKGFFTVFSVISKNSDEIEQQVKSFDIVPKESPDFWKQNRLNWNKEVYKNIPKNSPLHSKYLKYLLGEHRDNIISDDNLAEFKRITHETNKQYYKSKIVKIKKISRNNEKLLSDYALVRHAKLDILSSMILFLCKNCKKIISIDSFKGDKCSCGMNIQTITHTDNVQITYFNSMLRNLINNNYWFEYGVDYLFRIKGFNTLYGYNAMGHSGNWHEIDNIIESSRHNLRIFCECKISAVTPNEVFIFAGKMADIGCSRGYFFTLGKNVNKTIAHLARSRNITIISDVFDKTISDLLKEINE